MKWEPRTEIMMAKEARSSMRKLAMRARLIIHPSERNDSYSFSEICWNSATYICWAIMARNRALAHEAKARELIIGGAQ